MDDNLIDLEFEYTINLRRLLNNEAEFTIEHFVAAMEATTTLTELTLDFYQYKPTPANNRRLIEPLCHCISNLRHHNEDHPLESLILCFSDIDENGIVEVYEKILVAAKQFGIGHMEINGVHCLPVQFLVEFCRDNNDIGGLVNLDVSFSSGAAALPLPLNHGPPNNSVILTLDSLTLMDLEFENSIAASVFANLFAHVNAWSLTISGLSARNNDTDEEDDNVDVQITECILSELKMPPAEELTLYSSCPWELFKANLEDGTTSVAYLFILISWDDPTEILELLASFIRRAAKLTFLTIHLVLFDYGPQVCRPPQLFQALEACATVTQIRVSREHERLADTFSDVTPDEEQQLRKITSRNCELHRFAKNPGTYPTEDLPELMCQFDNCPTGRYMLARRLPEVFSFAELQPMHISRRRTNPPIPKKAKLQ